jgi:pimeloyl-ACP methyl ester carboxylesterase
VSAAYEDRWCDSAGVPLRYVTAGEGEPVVLAHSYSSDLEHQWVRTGVLEALSAHFRVIAFDQRGHGKSGKPHEPQAYGREMALDIVRLLDHLGIDKAHIVGYSLGAHTVAQLLTLHPERFLSATLGGGSGRRKWTAANERQAEIEAAEMEKGSLRTQMLRLRPKGKEAPTDEAIRVASARFLKGKDPRALAAVRRSNGDQIVKAEDLAASGVPTLGIVGSVDPYLEDLRELKALMPELEMVVIEGAAHASAHEFPEFVRAVEGFIAKVGS